MSLTSTLSASRGRCRSYWWWDMTFRPRLWIQPCRCDMRERWSPPVWRKWQHNRCRRSTVLNGSPSRGSDRWWLVLRGWPGPKRASPRSASKREEQWRHRRWGNVGVSRRRSRGHSLCSFPGLRVVVWRAGSRPEGWQWRTTWWQTGLSTRVPTTFGLRQLGHKCSTEIALGDTIAVHPMALCSLKNTMSVAIHDTFGFNAALHATRVTVHWETHVVSQTDMVHTVLGSSFPMWTPRHRGRAPPQLS